MNNTFICQVQDKLDETFARVDCFPTRIGTYQGTIAFVADWPPTKVHGVAF